MHLFVPVGWPAAYCIYVVEVLKFRFEILKFGPGLTRPATGILQSLISGNFHEINEKLKNPDIFFL